MGPLVGVAEGAGLHGFPRPRQRCPIEYTERVESRPLRRGRPGSRVGAAACISGCAGGAASEAGLDSAADRSPLGRCSIT